MLRRLFSFYSKSTLRAFSIPWNWFHSLPFATLVFETSWAAVGGNLGTGLGDSRQGIRSTEKHGCGKLSGLYAPIPQARLRGTCPRATCNSLTWTTFSRPTRNAIISLRRHETAGGTAFQDAALVACKNAALAVEANQIPLSQGARDDLEFSCSHSQPAHHPSTAVYGSVGLGQTLSYPARLNHYPNDFNLNAQSEISSFIPVPPAAEYSRLLFSRYPRIGSLIPSREGIRAGKMVENI